MIRRIKKGVVGVLDDGTVLVYDEEAEREFREKGVKVIRVGKVTAS
jgi:hypothetical protein